MDKTLEVLKGKVYNPLEILKFEMGKTLEVPKGKVEANNFETVDRLNIFHVWQTPDDNKSTVFNKGTFQGFKIAIPLGGQMAPNSIAGVNDE